MSRMELQGLMGVDLFQRALVAEHCPALEVMFGSQPAMRHVTDLTTLNLHQSWFIVPAGAIAQT